MYSDTLGPLADLAPEKLPADAPAKSPDAEALLTLTVAVAQFRAALRAMLGPLVAGARAIPEARAAYDRVMRLVAEQGCAPASPPDPDLLFGVLERGIAGVVRAAVDANQIDPADPLLEGFTY